MPPSFIAIRMSRAVVIGLCVMLIALIIGVLVGLIMRVGADQRLQDHEGTSDPAIRTTVVPAVSLHEPAPEFTLTAPSGETVTGETWAEQPYVLAFWASWCAPCVHMLDDIASLRGQEAIRSRIHITAVNVAEEPAAAAGFMSGRGWDIPLLFDRDGAAAGVFGVALLPAVIVVDQYGYVIDRLFDVAPPGTYAARLQGLLPKTHD